MLGGNQHEHSDSTPGVRQSIEEETTRRISAQFATEGAALTTIDLKRYFPALESAQLVSDTPGSTLEGATLSLSHPTPLHEEVAVEVVNEQRGVITERFWYAVQPASTPAYPIGVSSNGRYLVDRTGAPVVINGDAAWELPTNRTKEEATTYHQDRQAKGFTAGIWRIITTRFTDQDPPYENAYEEPPFSSEVRGALDFTDVNDAYWQHVDWCFREAYAHGYLVFAAPAYVGFNNGGQGWTEAMIANKPGRMRAYGEWLAERYAGYPNIIWVAGGDSDLGSEANAHNAMMEGIVAGETHAIGEMRHLVTAKSKRGRSALDDYNYPWLTLNATYSKTTSTSSETNNDYFNRSPIVPTIYIEGWYENEHDMTARQLRRQYYWALLEGAAGHIYGNCPVWSFGETPNFCDDPDVGVETSYDSPGAEDVRHLSALLDVRTLLVDGGAYMGVDTGRLVIRGKWRLGQENYVSARYNGRTAVIYLPEEKTITVDLAQLSDVVGEVRAAWYDPDTGTTTLMDDTFSSSSGRDFRRPVQEIGFCCSTTRRSM